MRGCNLFMSSSALCEWRALDTFHMVCPLKSLNVVLGEAEEGADMTLVSQCWKKLRERSSVPAKEHTCTGGLLPGI